MATFASGRAWAICPTDGCEPNTNLDCYDICTPVTIAGKITVVCDLDVTETEDLDAFAISVNGVEGSLDVCGEYDYYCAWGRDTSGRNVYCGWSDYGGDLVGVNLKGGSGDDTLSFLCEESINPTVEAQMEEYADFAHTLPFLGRIDGGTGNDTIIGSRQSSDKYSDAMYGWDGNDDIASHEGADYIDAGSGQDRVCSGSGGDNVQAGPGHDDVVVEGGATVNGGAGDDDILLDGSGSYSFDGGIGTNRCDPGGTNCSTTTGLSLHICPS